MESEEEDKAKAASEEVEDDVEVARRCLNIGTCERVRLRWSALADMSLPFLTSELCMRVTNACQNWVVGSRVRLAC